MKVSTLLLLALSTACSWAAPEAFMSWPDIHGQNVVFTSEGDLWIGDITTMQARRITVDVGTETEAHFSPDGTQLAYMANYDGGTSVYRMNLGNGVAERITFDANRTFGLSGWAADSSRLLVNTWGANPAVDTLSWVDLKTKVVTQLPIEMASHASISPDRKQLVMTRISQTWQAWFGYEGGQVNPIWVGNLDTMTFKKVYQSKGSNEYPVMLNNRIYFVQDDKGDFSVKSIKPDGTDLKTVAGPYDVEVQYLQGQGNRLVYMKGAGLEMVDLQSGKISPLDFRLSSDAPKSRPFLVKAEDSAQNMSLASDAKRVWVEARGQIVSIPVKDGAARVVLEKPGVRFQMPAALVDKKKLAYVSDQTGEQQIYVSGLDGANPVQLTSDLNRTISSIRWSPDGKWVAFCDSYNRLRLVNVETKVVTEVFRNPQSWLYTQNFDISSDSKWIVYEDMVEKTGESFLVLYQVDTQTKHRLDMGLMQVSRPVFSKDGKWIVFLNPQALGPTWDPVLNQMNSTGKRIPMMLALSKDTLSPILTKVEEEPKPESEPPKKDAPIKVDLDGLELRIVKPNVTPDVYERVEMVGDRLLLATNSELTYYDLTDRKGGTISAIEPFAVVPEYYSLNFSVSDDGKKVILYGPKQRVIDAAATEVAGNTGEIQYGGLQLLVDPKAEASEIYVDAWRKIRDYFYADNMHGVNWESIKKKYEPYVRLVRDRNDLDQILEWMRAEVNTGHMYGSSGDSRSLFKDQPSGYLGADFTPDAGYLKVKKILRGNGQITPSPLAGVGLNINVGTYILEIGGVPAVPGTDYFRGLRGRAGKPVEIVVNDKPTREGARTVLITPIATEGRLRYYDWVDSRRKYVTDKSGGKLGYIHLSAMGENDFADFIRQYFPQRDKEGLVIDIRYNGGGNLAGPLRDILSKKTEMWGSVRNGASYPGRSGDAFIGHMVCLVNEHSYSEGEGFPFYFRKDNLGPIIGKRTWGGYVGSWPSWPLVDGGSVAVSHYGGWNPGPEGWVIEGEGIVPDITVENDPTDFAKGIDSQLDKGIEVLLKQIKDKPVVWPTQPPFPTKPLHRAKPPQK